MRKTTLLTLSALFLAACSDSTGPGSSSGSAQVSLSFTAGAGSAQVPNPWMSFSQVAGPITDGENTIEITSAVLVLREIELKRVEVVDCDVEPEPEGCESFETGPLLINVPLDGGTERSLTIAIDLGTYDEVRFDIHKISNDDPADAAFAEANPEMLDNSIRVIGTYNGELFTYETDLNEKQRFNLSPSLVIDETTTSANVTVRLDISQWFRDGAGMLIDPNSANKGGDNENLVKDNIKDSIEAFEDADEDGNRG